mmetsp:Transcript_29822/g.104992  ORF Transcript_29822/g.104992 Transcript_29822/m.104992 type:complete len:330 (-) Transcript_29822:1704-2693(-)
MLRQKRVRVPGCRVARLAPPRPRRRAYALQQHGRLVVERRSAASLLRARHRRSLAARRRGGIVRVVVRVVRGVVVFVVVGRARRAVVFVVRGVRVVGVIHHLLGARRRRGLAVLGPLARLVLHLWLLGRLLLRGRRGRRRHRRLCAAVLLFLFGRRVVFGGGGRGRRGGGGGGRLRGVCRSGEHFLFLGTHFLGIQLRKQLRFRGGGALRGQRGGALALARGEVRDVAPVFEGGLSRRKVRQHHRRRPARLHQDRVGQEHAHLLQVADGAARLSALRRLQGHAVEAHGHVEDHPRLKVPLRVRPRQHQVVVPEVQAQSEAKVVPRQELC